MKFIREKLGWTAYRMTKELGIKSQSTYAALETRGKTMKAETLVRLQELAEQAGFTLDEFWAEFKKEVKSRKEREDREKKLRDER